MNNQTTHTPARMAALSALDARLDAIRANYRGDFDCMAVETLASFNALADSLGISFDEAVTLACGNR